MRSIFFRYLFLLFCLVLVSCSEVDRPKSIALEKDIYVLVKQFNPDTEEMIYGYFIITDIYINKRATIIYNYFYMKDVSVYLDHKNEKFIPGKNEDIEMGVDLITFHYFALQWSYKNNREIWIEATKPYESKENNTIQLATEFCITGLKVIHNINKNSILEQCDGNWKK